MSLLLEALKKAEKAKEEAQQRARAAATARADDEPPASSGRGHVRTRDELPDITQPLEILTEDLRADAPAREASPALGLVDDAPARDPEPPPRQPASRAAKQPAAADRNAAKRVFEAKYREPNPRLPFYIAMGVLGTLCAGTGVYFWNELRTKSPLVNINPQRPAGEQAVAVAPAAPSAPAAVQPQATAPQIPGLPAVSGAAPVGAAPVAAAAPPAAAAPAAPPPAVPGAAKSPPPAVVAPAAKPASQAPAASAPPVPAGARPAAPSRAPLAGTPRAESPALTFSQPQPAINPRVQTAYAAFNAGDFASAHAGYEQALREEPGNRDALLGLAAIESLSGRPEAAAAHYRRLLSADPRDPHAQAGIIALRSQSIDPVQAESRVKNLLAASPESNVLYFTLGNQYAEQRRWAEAQQAYFKAHTADPENPDFAYNLAVSLDHLRQAALARDYYERALALALKRHASFDQPAARARAQQLAR